MKKTLFLLLLPLLALSVFAQDYLEEIELPTKDIFIEGTSVITDHYSYFMDNFTMEAMALGFNVVGKADAGYIFRFDVQRYIDDFDPANVFIVLISLIINDEDQREIVSFGWPYSSLDEMYEYNQFVFFRAVVLIPGIDEEELRSMLRQALPDTRWREQKLYLRFSFEFPVTFYTLIKNDNLYHQTAAWKGTDIDKPESVGLLDNRVMALPALTIGLELAFIKYLTIEPKIMLGWEHLTNRDHYFLLTAGLELKYPFKLRSNVLLQPYITGTYPLFSMSLTDGFSISKITETDVFADFPMIGIGGGLEINLRAGKRSAVFFDINYMYYIGKAGIKNPFHDNPNPAVIQYNRSVIGIGIGYKLGFLGPK